MPDVLDPLDPNDAVEIAAREASGVPHNPNLGDDALQVQVARRDILYPALEHPVGGAWNGSQVEIEYNPEALHPDYQVVHYPGFRFPPAQPGGQLEDDHPDLAAELGDRLAVGLDVPHEVINPEATHPQWAPTFAEELDRLHDRYDPSVRELFEAGLGLYRYGQDTDTPNALLADMVINLLDAYEVAVTRR